MASVRAALDAIVTPPAVTPEAMWLKAQQSEQLTQVRDFRERGYSYLKTPKTESNFQWACAG
jgi:hypothetical protein